MVRKVLLVLWLISQISGFLFASYGVLRESFADMAQSRGFGEGRFGEGANGGDVTKIQELLVVIGTRSGLLPDDRILTMTDRKRNASWAIAGVILIGFSIVFDLVLRFVRRE